MPGFPDRRDTAIFGVHVYRSVLTNKPLTRLSLLTLLYQSLAAFATHPAILPESLVW